MSRGIFVFRSIYYLPAVTSGVAVAILWQFVFHKQWGILNAILAVFGVGNHRLAGGPAWVMVAFVIMSIWGVGGSMIIYLAGLQSIPTELYESAAIDGANQRQQVLAHHPAHADSDHLLRAYHRADRRVPDFRERLHHDRRRADTTPPISSA